MKTLDRFLLKSFIGPFIVTFCIAWFVLLMQFLWFFLEKIADKGLSFGLVLELIAYRSVGLLPLAIPLGALIASVMTVGGLAERYELSAFQSAGTSFGRVLRPLVVVGLALGVGSYLTSDYLIPAANLKFLYRLADVQQKKPALSLQPGVFNEDLKPYAFYAAGRAPDGKTLTDILLYAEQTANGNLNQISAEAGVFTNVPATKELHLTLHNGVNYQQQAGDAFAPLVRTYFKSYTMVFDLSQFDLIVRPDEEKSGHYAMLTTWQLQHASDSVYQIIRLDRDTFVQRVGHQLAFNPQIKSGGKAKSPQTTRPTGHHTIPANFAALASERRNRLTQKAKASIRRASNEARAMVRKERDRWEVGNRFLFEKHAKLALAVVCIIFTVVGGATGAIVRKGGFGYPLLVSTGCFVAYVFLLEFCKRLMKAGEITAVAAGWIPVVLLAGLTILLLKRIER